MLYDDFVYVDLPEFGVSCVSIISPLPVALSDLILTHSLKPTLPYEPDKT